MNDVNPSLAQVFPVEPDSLSEKAPPKLDLQDFTLDEAVKACDAFTSTLESAKLGPRKTYSVPDLTFTRYKGVDPNIVGSETGRISSWSPGEITRIAQGRNTGKSAFIRGAIAEALAHRLDGVIQDNKTKYSSFVVSELDKQTYPGIPRDSVKEMCTKSWKLGVQGGTDIALAHCKTTISYLQNENFRLNKPKTTEHEKKKLKLLEAQLELLFDLVKKIESTQL